MTAPLSKTQIDQLGNRLRRGPLVEADLRSLDEYRRSFGAPYETVVRTIREQLGLEPTGRPAKSTGSLIEKLHRESIRLTQVQDIAGCRLVVTDVAAQARVVTSLRTAFPGASVTDRREHPSYGYRAVHVIVQISAKLVEIQVRTSLQHLWAELSEKLSDIVDPAIKYGGGADDLRGMLTQLSEVLSDIEATETELAASEAMIARLPAEGTREQYAQRLRDLQQPFIQKKQVLVEKFNKTISALERLKGRTL